MSPASYETRIALSARQLDELAAIRKTSPQARPPVAARQRQRDEAALMLESISDEFDVQSLLDTDDPLLYRRDPARRTGRISVPSQAGETV